MPVARVVSCGQTGVDRAGLDAAIACGLPHGGWCPRGRRAEDGAIPARYRLRETASPEYYVRTDRNVRDSDGTVVLTAGSPAGGSALTLQYATQRGRPALVLDLDAVAPAAAAAKLAAWVAEHAIATLNVAGPRESSAPGIYRRARAVLEAALGGPR
jgi:hypothetical protein